MSILTVNIKEINRDPIKYGTKLARCFVIKPNKINEWWDTYATELKFSVMKIILDQLMLNDHINPNKFLFIVAAKGQLELTEYLLLHNSIDPHTLDGGAFSVAVKNNHTNIVKLFLTLDMVNYDLIKIALLHVIEFGTDLMAFILITCSLRPGRPITYGTEILYKAIMFNRKKIAQIYLYTNPHTIESEKMTVLKNICHIKDTKAIEIAVRLFQFETRNIINCMIYLIQINNIDIFVYFANMTGTNIIYGIDLIKVACLYGSTIILDQLLVQYKVFNIIKSERISILQFACKQSNSQIIQILLRHGLYNMEELMHWALHYITTEENILILKYLLHLASLNQIVSINTSINSVYDNMSPTHDFNILSAYIKENEINVFRSTYEFESQNEFVTDLINALDKPLTFELLLGSSLVDPAEFNSGVLIEAVRRNEYRAIQLLLSDNRINASTYNNISLILAVHYENDTILKLLLGIKDLNFDAQVHFLVNYLCLVDNYNLAKILLSDPRVDLKLVSNINYLCKRQMDIQSLLASHKFIRHFMFSMVAVFDRFGFGLIELFHIVAEFYVRSIIQ